MEALIEELDLDIDLEDEVEEIDLADKELDTVPLCIFELKDCTTLALESKSVIFNCCLVLNYLIIYY